jgi:membrane-associated phospholipid phosphatase
MARARIRLPVVAAVLAVVVFTALAILVAVHPEPFGIDLAGARAAARLRTDPLTVVMRAFSFLGSFPAIATQIALIGGVIVLVRRDPRPGLWMLAAALGAWLLSNGFKALLDRPRPEPGLVDAGGASFPSGHATQGTSYFVMLAMMLMGVLPRPWRGVAAFIAVALGLLSGLSRIYLGVHWTTDVIGGFALGLAWSCALLSVRPQAIDPPIPGEPPER